MLTGGRCGAQGGFLCLENLEHLKIRRGHVGQRSCRHRMCCKISASSSPLIGGHKHIFFIMKLVKTRRWLIGLYLWQQLKRIPVFSNFDIRYRTRLSAESEMK